VGKKEEDLQSYWSLTCWTVSFFNWNFESVCFILVLASWFHKIGQYFWSRK